MQTSFIQLTLIWSYQILWFINFNAVIIMHRVEINDRFKWRSNQTDIPSKSSVEMQ